MARDVGLAHEFVFHAATPLRSVAVVGSFNRWNKDAAPMRVDADGLTWRATLPLPYGRYVYKFATFSPNNEEKWIVDPRAPLDPTDKVNDNSVLMVTPAGYDLPASPDDGRTATEALLHPHSERDFSYEAGTLTLTLRARPNDLRAIEVITSTGRYPMKLTRTDALFAFYRASVAWDGTRDLTYRFVLHDGTRSGEFGENGWSSHARPFRLGARSFRPYLLSDAPEQLKMEGPLTTRTVAGPAWAQNQPIYEVNLDSYHFARGTALREFEKHLPILKQMGVGLVWFMPLHPRGQKKGFGSPYSVRDYTDINPDLGTKADFKHLVRAAHALGLRVLMDWVPNHSSWDNPLIEAHPEFYVRDRQGQILQAQSWADVAQLDYGTAKQWNTPLWNVMRDNMALWVRDFDVDGFRCDVAGSNGRVPVKFWQWLRPQLDAIKPVFLLAEADNPEMHPAFDMTYSWALPPVLWDVCAGRRPATAIDDVLRSEARALPDGAIRMRFLDNHDWHPHADWGWGTGPAVDTHRGQAVAPLMVLCATLPGKPLLYNGQELSFEKTDPSPSPEAPLNSPVWPFYQALLTLYGSQPALSQGRFEKLVSNDDAHFYAFTRTRGASHVLIVVNLSDQARTAKLQSAALAGHYVDSFAHTRVDLKASPSIALLPWGYRVLVAHPGN